MKQLIEISKNNSIGSDKKCSNMPITKKIEKVAVYGALTGVLLVCGAVGYQEFAHEEFVYDSIEYPISEIEDYERDNLYTLLDRYNFNDYKEQINGNRIYNYNASQYQTISELDETYLYSFYLNTDDNTFNEVLKSFGYDDLDSFLYKNGYLDEQNKPSIKEWRKNDKEYAIKQIQSKEGKSK